MVQVLLNVANTPSGCIQHVILQCRYRSERKSYLRGLASRVVFPSHHYSTDNTGFWSLGDLAQEETG